MIKRSLSSMRARGEEVQGTAYDEWVHHLRERVPANSAAVDGLVGGRHRRRTEVVVVWCGGGARAPCSLLSICTAAAAAAERHFCHEFRFFFRPISNYLGRARLGRSLDGCNPVARV